MKPSLYGIKRSNRDFSDPYYWGKNQFNSSFPVSLACHMKDQGERAVYLKLGKNLQIEKDEIDFINVFGTELKNEDIYFAFEARYEPFRRFIHDELKPVDLVIKSKKDQDIRPIEIKLTTLPDNSTSEKKEAEYGTELVIRSPTMRYMALSMADSFENHFYEIREIFENPCSKIRDWNNVHEIKQYREDIFSSLESFFRHYQEYEKPFLMQPVWKTIGKSAQLDNYCLDVFVWSDFALTRLFMDSATVSKGGGITRQQRTALRLARFLYEISKNSKVYQQPIYDGMTYDTLNDKEFAISGVRTNPYMRCKRLTRPLVHKSRIKRIILGGGQKYLSPERRFDAIIYFSKDLFDE